MVALRGIFLSEKCEVGLDDVEELGDDCGDAAKVSGTRFAAELVAEAFDGDVGDGARGIHFGGRWREENVDGFFFKQLNITVEGAGIFCEILGGAELQRVYENGSGDGIAFRFCSAHQREMPVVQRAHGRDQSQTLSCVTRRTRSGAHFVDRFADFHGALRRMEPN